MISRQTLGLPGPALRMRATTFDTWNPDDKGSLLNLTNENLTVNNPGSTPGAGVRATVGKQIGKWYWEIAINAGIFNEARIGVASRNGALTELGGGAEQWAYTSPAGKKISFQNTVFNYGAAFTAGHVISVLLDMDVGLLEFKRNNVSQGVAYSAGLLGLVIYPAVSIRSSFVVTANFGATAFVYAVPSGYNAGIYA